MESNNSSNAKDCNAALKLRLADFSMQKNKNGYVKNHILVLK